MRTSDLLRVPAWATRTIGGLRRPRHSVYRSRRRLVATSALAATAIIGTNLGFSPAAEGATKTPMVTPIVDLTAKSVNVSKGGYLDLTASARDVSGAPMQGRLDLQRNDKGKWVTIGSTQLSVGYGRFHFKIWNAHTFRAVVAVPVATSTDQAASRPVPVKTVLNDVAFGTAVVADAAKHKGAPYVWDTAGPLTFDCSGLVKYVFAKYGIILPHHADDMKHYGKEISRSEARPGDLVFAFNGTFAHHVAIYAGKGTWWEAPHTGAFVQHAKLRGKHLEFRRVAPTNHGVTW